MIIYKYPLPIKQFIQLAMPVDSEILTFQVQNENPVLWAKHKDLKSEWAIRHFTFIGTGNEYDQESGHVYIGTIQLKGFVWHLFEIVTYQDIANQVKAGILSSGCSNWS